MTEQNTEAVAPPPKATTNIYWKVLKWVLIGLVSLILILVVALYMLAKSKDGSKFLVNTVLNSVPIIQSEYKSGTLVDGVTLENVIVNVKNVKVEVIEPTLILGWRSILDKQIHLSQLHANVVDITNSAAPNNDPFSFPEVNLPFILRVDDLTVNKLIIKTGTTQVDFNAIKAKDVNWTGPKIEFENAQADMGYLNGKNLTGFIALHEKYPIDVAGDLTIPALNTINIQTMKVKVLGSLDTLKAGVATNMPDLMVGSLVAHPLRKNVPMTGKLGWKDFNWPYLAQQNLHSEAGWAKISGDLAKLMIDIDTDLVGDSIPHGTYQGQLSTNLKQLNIEDFRANLMQGQVQLNGVLDWQKGVSWDVKGKMNGLMPDDKNIPAVIQEFLPPNMNATLGTKGRLDPNLDLIAHVDFDQYEDWTLKFAKPNDPKNKSPLSLNVAWRNINRNIPYVGWLNSQRGDVDLVLNEKGQDIYVKTDIDANPQSMLPAGQYATALNFADQVLQIKDFSLVNSGKKLLWGNAKVHLPTETTQLLWQADLKANQFNPSSIIASFPVQNVSGAVKANGYAKPQQQIIQLRDIDLVGDLQQANSQQKIQLNGQSNIALLFHDGQQQQGFKSYAVNYDGELGLVDQKNSINITQSPLVVKLSGTPSFINFEKIYHNGAAGQIDATGKLGFGQRIYWDIQAKLNQFKPSLFSTAFESQDFLDGSLKSNGEWSDYAKIIHIKDLALKGKIKSQALLGEGNLSFNAQNSNINFSQNNRLLLSYANNVLQLSNKNTSSNVIELRVKAPNLSQIHIPQHRLSGRVEGTVEFGLINNAISLESLSDLKANFVANNLNYNNRIKVQQVRMLGSVPTSTTQADQLKVIVDNLDILGTTADPKTSNIIQADSKNTTETEKVTATLSKVNPVPQSMLKIDQIALSVEGKKQDHILKFAMLKNESSVGLSLKGGFKDQSLWQGQLQNSLIRIANGNLSTALQQQQSATTQVNLKEKTLSIGQHCWVNKATSLQDKTCFNAPILISPEQQKINAGIESFNLGNLNVFLPNDMKLVGRLTGQLNVHNTPNKLDLNADLNSVNGKVLVGRTNAFSYDKFQFTAQKNGNTGYDIVAYVDKSKNLPRLIDVKLNTDADLNLRNNSKIILRGLSLNILKPFISDVRTLDGDLRMEVDLAGKLSSPILKSGFVQVKNGNFALSSVPVDLQEIDARINLIKANHATILSKFKAGKGVGLLTGDILNLFSSNMEAKLNLEGAHLKVVQQPLVDAAISPNLDISISPNAKKLTVNGFIGIPMAIISMPEATQNVVSVSPDVRIVDYNEKLAYIRASKGWSIDADIDVQLNASKAGDRLQNNRVIFSAFDSQIPLIGRLKLSQRGSEIALRATGVLAVDSRKNVPTIQAYGQRLSLNRAIARFNGELANPILDIEAAKNVQNALIRLSVTGEVANPRVQVLNDAGLSEQEATNALVTGRISSGASGVGNSEGFKSAVNNTIAAAGISMGLGGTRAFTNQLGRSLGLQGLSLDAQGMGDDTQVSVTGYITPDLYLRYGVGIFTPINTLTMRYQVNRRIYVEATSALERAIDIFYNWRF